jgi:4-hydroxybenzoate polyprenyltransferase
LNNALKEILKRIADPLIFGNIVIAVCASWLVLATYIQLGYTPVLDALLFFTFFSTLALYNFHRLMGIRRIKPEDEGEITGWAAKNQFTLLMLVIIGLGGAGFFVFQLPLSIVLTMIPLGAISVLYELPVIKFNKRFERLRNLYLSKAFLITLVWGVSTALLPAINIHHSLLDYKVWLVVIERMIFIFMLALAFDARDIEYDLKDQIKTIPIVYGVEKTKEFFKILSVVLFAMVILHYFIINQFWGVGIGMSLSIAITYYILMNSIPKKSDYYYLFYADGMMALQFILVWALAWFK